MSNFNANNSTSGSYVFVSCVSYCCISKFIVELLHLFFSDIRDRVSCNEIKQILLINFDEFLHNYEMVNMNINLDIYHLKILLGSVFLLRISENIYSFSYITYLVQTDCSLNSYKWLCMI